MIKETIPSKKQNQASLKEHTIVLVFALSHCHALKKITTSTQSGPLHK